MNRLFHCLVRTDGKYTYFNDLNILHNYYMSDVLVLTIIPNIRSSIELSLQDNRLLSIDSSASEAEATIECKFLKFKNTRMQLLITNYIEAITSNDNRQEIMQQLFEKLYPLLYASPLTNEVIDELLSNRRTKSARSNLLN